MKIYLSPYFGSTSRIYFYEMEKHLSFDDYKKDVWDSFTTLFQKMDKLSVWGGCDKSENKDYVPSMKSWEVPISKADVFFDFVQAYLDKMGIDFEIGYPQY